MFLIKLFGKMLLLPVIILLGVLKLLIKIGMELSSIVLGALMLIVFGCIVFTVIKHIWSSMAVLVVIEISLVMIAAGTGFIEGLLDVASDNLGSFMRS